MGLAREVVDSIAFIDGERGGGVRPPCELLGNP
jgi:hypothetical protein